MTRETMKDRLRARGSYRPEHELLLDSAIDDTIQIIWDFHDWSWKLGVDSFTSTGTATYELDSDVDSLLEMTYGSTNRFVAPAPSHLLTEMYDNQARTGDTVYYYRLYETTPERLTIELIPTPSSGDVFTYRYRRKLAEGDLGQIPSKLHPVVLIGSGAQLVSGDPYSVSSFTGMLSHAMQRDKPIVRKRWSMGLDGLTATRVMSRNAMIHGGTATDTSRPID